MSRELAAQFARRFIQNRATKAIQFANGDYVPDRRLKDPSRHGIGFGMQHLEAHLASRETYGHYLLDSDSNCRMFAFDIDLRDEGSYCVMPDFTQVNNDIDNATFDETVKTYGPVNPVELWHDRTQIQARTWYKQQMMTLVHRFTGAVLELGIGSASAYSGNKGVHVYGFMPEPMPAVEVRDAAMMVMEQLDDFEVLRGKNFFKHRNFDPIHGYPSFSVEVFPKQTSVSDKGGLGNLMRLPLGRNLKHNDPTFFLDLKAPVAQMRPHPNPLELLTSGDPYA